LPDPPDNKMMFIFFISNFYLIVILITYKFVSKEK
jgi:hypothetical protein